LWKFFSKKQKKIWQIKKNVIIYTSILRNLNLTIKRRKIMKHFLSQKYKNAVCKYKKFRARFEKSLQEGVSAHKKQSLYQRLKKLYQQIVRLETQLKWAVSAGALSLALTALPNPDALAQGQGKFKYFERKIKLEPKTGYVAQSAPTYPTFADLDNDGDKDLIIGQYTGGALFYQRNDTTGLVYTLIPNDDDRSPFKDAAADMQGYSYFNPSFADMDGDGDLDMIVGYNYYKYDYVTLFKNVDGKFVPFTGAANPFAFVIMGDGTGIDGGARGEMFDADEDGDLDLFVSGSDEALGDKYGINVKYYENYESGTGVFQEVTGTGNPLDQVNITPGPLFYYTGYGSLTFADGDNDGDLDAYITEKYGAVYEYKNNGSNTFGPQTLHPTLTIPGIPYYPFAIGAAFEDFDDDGDLDVIYGDKYYQTLPYKKNNGTGVFSLVTYDVNDPTNVDFDIEQELFPAAYYTSSTATADLDGDGDLDAVTFGIYGDTYLFRNLGSTENPNFELVTTSNPFTPLNGLTYGPTIDLVDFDNDGDADLVVKEFNVATPRYFRNNNNASFTELTGASNPLSTISINPSPNLAKIQLIDYDNDGDFDLIAGDDTSIRVFRNDGSNFSELTGTNNPFNSINTALAVTTPAIKRISPTLVDIDNDGDLDLLLGTLNNLDDPSTTANPDFNRTSIYYYKNNGGVYEANVADNPFNGIAVNRWALLEFNDIDGDNDLDAFLGELRLEARVRYFERAGNNFCPKVQEIRREINTNEVYEFAKEEFREVYSDEPDTKNKDFPKIKILIPPAYGKLMIGGEIATFGLEIPYAALDNMTYTPNNGYTGIDNFVWAAFDPIGECYSNGGNFRFGVGTDVTAINDDLVGSVVVFPNPAKDKFNINLDKNLSGRVEVKLYNTLGGVVHSATYQNPAEVRSIDVSKLPNGLYILQINNEGKNGVFKLVKE
jgi:hypothetical protein